jgi:hypothetical protein
VKELDGVLYSAAYQDGDTSYAGVAPLGGSRFLVTWYSSPLAGDPSWLAGFQGQTDIWQATLDLAKL